MKRLALIIGILICLPLNLAYGEKVVFVKKLTDHDELWVKGNNTERFLIKEVTSPKLLSPKGPAKRPLHLRGEPQMSVDGTKVFFLAKAWETSTALHSVDIDSGEERFITDANFLRVIRKGKYKGKLAVEQHKYFKGPGTYDFVWLIEQDGKVIGPLGDWDISQLDWEMYELESWMQ